MSPRVRSAVLLGVVVLMLLAGYLLQKLEDRGDDPADEVPASDMTPAALDATPTQGSAIEPTDVAGSTVAPERDLARDESAGGHTVARHVDKTDAELRDRLKQEPDISAASTYTDLATAQRVVAEVLEKKKSEIQKWEARDGNRPNLVLRLDLRETVGRSMKQGKSEALAVQDALVVLRWTGSSWFVLTSYPEDR